MLAMVEDVVWRLRWRKVMSDEFYYRTLPDTAGEEGV
jgi:hypothetical protein